MTKARWQSRTSSRQHKSKKIVKIKVCERDPVLSVNGKSIFCTEGYIPEQVALSLINQQYKRDIKPEVFKKCENYHEPKEREFNGKVTQY